MMTKESFISEVVESMEVEDLLIKQFDDSPELMMIINNDGTILRVNKMWYYVLGYKPQEMHGVKFWNFVDEDDVEDTRSVFRNENYHEKFYVNNYIRKDGEKVKLQWSSKTTTNKNSVLARAKIKE